ncbi:MAG: enoyl-CoA hydratase/isomerase family protein [Actinobacteria bacterium]|nr:enoyl-CoA hydratase/isomerase family protein [Actinomycetota bacterium]
MLTVVLLDVADGVGVITLNRPEKLNAFNLDMARGLGEAYAQCDRDDDVRAVVVTGAGRAFCAGADMSAPAQTFDLPKESGASRAFSSSPVQPAAWEVRKPVIAAINGSAIGIGLTIALQCDLRFVARDAKLSIPQVRRGVLGDMGVHWTLPHATSMAVAADVLLTGRQFTGVEAVQLGIASRVLPAKQVLTAAVETARDIAENCAPLSLALSKRALWAGRDRAGTEELESLYHRLTMGRPDAREGPMAWFEKRRPDWQLRVDEEWPGVLAAEELDRE